MRLYNTLTRSTDELIPINAGKVSIYTCGPTVYDYQHIGNYWGYIYWDVLVRTLQSEGLEVNRVMNITDVGHLVSDDDEGEDKLEKGAKREGKSAREVADFYTNDFIAGMKELGLLEPTYAKATDYINEQISMVQQLLDEGFAYKTDQAIYFDVTKLEDYGKLSGQKLADKEVAARAEVITDENKKNPHDFAVWFFKVGRFKDHEMHWDSPWGQGFPGWHLECSSIIHATLGDPIDIHAGGIDHIGTHHTNEIAQTEGAYKNQLANIWLHNSHLMIDGQKISKSIGNVVYLKDIMSRGFSLMDYKVFTLQSSYRNQSNFSWDNLNSAKNRLQAYRAFADLRFQPIKFNSPSSYDFKKELSLIVDDLNNDLNTPSALSHISKLNDNLQIISTDQVTEFTTFLETIDSLLGLDLTKSTDISKDQKDLISERLQARNNKEWKASDQIRDELLKAGIGLRDSEQGTVWFRI